MRVNDAFVRINGGHCCSWRARATEIRHFYLEDARGVGKSVVFTDDTRETAPECAILEMWTTVDMWTRVPLRASSGWPAGKEARADHGQDGLAALIVRLVTNADHATVGLARRRANLEDLSARGDRVAGAHRPEP